MPCHFEYTGIGLLNQSGQMNGTSNNYGPRSDTRSLCNSVCIKPLATSIHNDICQLYDQHTVSCGRLNELDTHNSRSHCMQMQKMLDKMNTLSKKVICLETMLMSKPNNIYPSSLKKYDIRNICNSTKSLIDLTTSLRHDVINKCQLRKPPSCYLSNCNDVSAIVEKIMLLENQLLELLTDAECKLEKEKYKLNVRVKTSPLFRGRSIEASAIPPSGNPAYSYCKCLDGISYRAGSCYPQHVCTDDQQYIYTEGSTSQADVCQRKDFHLRKSNLGYTHYFDNEDELYNRSDSFMLCKKPARHQTVCTSRKYKMKSLSPTTEECLSVSEPRIFVCEPCERKHCKMQNIKCQKTDKCHKNKYIKFHKLEKCLPDPEPCVTEPCALAPEPCRRRRYKVQNIKCQKTVKCVPKPEPCPPIPCESFVKVMGNISCVTVDVRKSCPVRRVPREPKIKHICPQRDICRPPCNVTSGMLDVRKSCSKPIYPKVKTVKCKNLPPCRSYINITKSETPYLRRSRSCKEIRPKVRKYKSRKCSCTSSYISVTKNQPSVRRSISTARRVKKIKSKTHRTYPKKTKSIISIYKSESVATVTSTDISKSSQRWQFPVKVSKSKHNQKSESASTVISTDISKSSQRWQFPVKVCKSKHKQKSCICVHKSTSSVCAKCISKVQRKECKKKKLRIASSQKLYPRLKKVNTNKQSRKVSVTRTKRSAISTKDSSTQASTLSKKSKTTGMLTDKVKYTNTIVQVKLEEDKPKIQTKDKGMNPVDELQPKPIKTHEISIATEPKTKPKKIDKGLDVLDLAPKKLKVHYGVNVNLEDPPVIKKTTTTACDAHKLKMISIETQNEKTLLTHFGANTDSPKITDHGTSPMKIPVDEKKSKGTITAEPELIITGTNTEIKKTVDKNFLVIPTTDEKEIYASLLEEKKIELKQAQTNTVELKLLDKKTNTSKHLNVEKEINVNIKRECSDKRTNTSKHEFVEKKISANMKIDKPIYLDKTTSTLIQKQEEKEITAHIKEDTSNKTTNTSALKFEDKIINTDYIMETPQLRYVHELIQMKIEKPKEMHIKEVIQRQGEIETRSQRWVKEPKQIYEIKSNMIDETHAKIELEAQSNTSSKTNEVEVKHSTNRYLLCDSKNKTYIYERSSIHKLSDGEYRENFDAMLETEHIQSPSDEYETNTEYLKTNNYQPNTGKEYTSILEEKCNQMLKQYGRRLKYRPQKCKNTCNCLSVRNDENGKKRTSEFQKSSTSTSSNSGETMNYKTTESTNLQATNENSSSENIIKNNTNKTLSQNKKQTKLKINLDKNTYDNDSSKLDNERSLDVSNENGKTIMHLSYSSSSSVQIVLPHGAYLYEDKEEDNQEENEKIKYKKKNNKRKKLNNMPNSDNFKDKEKCISKWIKIANKIRDNYVQNSSYFTLATCLNCNCQNSKSDSLDSSDTSSRSNWSKNRKEKSE